MLTIGKLGASTSQLDYYERQVAAGAEDYYAGRGESPGVVVLGAGRDLALVVVELARRRPELADRQHRHLASAISE